MKIKIDNTILDFHFLTEFENFKKYQTKEEAEYNIYFEVSTFDIPLKFDLSTNFYDVYEEIQYQKNENGYYATIKYEEKDIYITMIKKDHIAEYLLAQYAFYHIFERKNNYLLMHGSSISYNNKGIIFTAKSGTGKSTHVYHWINNTNAIVLNDDKNLLKLYNNEIYLIANPFSGKHYRDNNITCKLNDIVFIIRDSYNHVSVANKKEAFKRLLSQLVMPNNQNQEFWSLMVDKLLNLNLYNLYCTKEKESLEVMKEVIDNETN